MGGCNGAIKVPCSNQVYPDDYHNVEEWLEIDRVCCLYGPWFCGLCFGLCGEFSPDDV